LLDSLLQERKIGYLIKGVIGQDCLLVGGRGMTQ